MNNYRLISKSWTVLVATFFILKLIFPVSLFAAHKPVNASQLKWAIILSPGPKPGVPWGGYHVTIAGYSKANTPEKKNFLENAYKSAFHGKPWHLHGMLPDLVKWKGTYTQTFKSHTLDELAGKLALGGFDKIKGPNHANVPWHISLHSDFATSQRKNNEFKLNKTNWYLWQVPEPNKTCQEHGTGCPSWHKVY